MIRASVFVLFLITFAAERPVSAQTSAESCANVVAAVAITNTTGLTAVSLQPAAAVPKIIEDGPQAHPTILALDVPMTIDPLRPGRLQSTGGRPRTQTALYGSFLVLQLLDAHSTRRALASGGREANPVMAPVVGNVAALAAVKVAGTALTIYLTEKLRKRNSTVAAAVTIGLNVLSVFVITHNYRVARQ